MHKELVATIYLPKMIQQHASDHAKNVTTHNFQNRDFLDILCHLIFFGNVSFLLLIKLQFS